MGGGGGGGSTIALPGLRPGELKKTLFLIKTEIFSIIHYYSYVSIAYVCARSVSNPKQGMPKTYARAKFKEHPSINTQVLERKLSAHGPSDGQTDGHTNGQWGNISH